MSRWVLGVCGVVASACAVTGPVRMTYRTVDSEAMGQPMKLGVWTPPDFQPGEHLPLFLFLHGGGDDVHCLDDSGISSYLDEELEAGRIPRVIMMVPEGDKGFWADWADGTHNYESWVMNEAMPLVEREYQTRGRHITGISMGGAGTLYFVLHHPGVFESAAILSGPTLDAKGMTEVQSSWFIRTFARLGRVFGDINDEERKRRSDPFQQWNEPADLYGLRLYFAHGDKDVLGIGDTNAHLHEHLAAAGIPHRYEVFHGGHKWEAWKPLFGELIRDGVKGPTTGAQPVGAR